MADPNRPPERRKSLLYQMIFERRIPPMAWSVLGASAALSLFVQLQPQVQPVFWNLWRTMIALFSFVFLAVLLFALRRRRGPVRRPVVAAVTVSVFLTVLVASLWTFLPPVARATAEALVRGPTFVFGLALAIGGVALFILRLKLRATYGLVEALIGLKVGLDKGVEVDRGMSHIALDFDSLLVVLTASLYLIVRGLDNLHTGLKAEKPGVDLRLLLWMLYKVIGAPLQKQDEVPAPEGV